MGQKHAEVNDSCSASRVIPLLSWTSSDRYRPRFEVLAAMLMKILAFRVVTPCRLVKLSTFRRHYVFKTSVPIYQSTRCIMPGGLSRYTYRVLRTRHWTLSSRLTSTPHYPPVRSFLAAGIAQSV